MKLTRRTRAAAAAAVSLTAVVVGVIGFVPAAFAAASATATPGTGLHDGQILSVSGAGLPANTTVQIMECQGTAATPPPDNGSCDGNTLDTQATTDGGGAFVNAAGDANGDSGYKVYALGTPGLTFPNSTIRCDVSHACVLYVGVDQNNFSAAHTFVDIAFAAPPATVVAPISPSPQALTVANLGSGNITVDYGTAKDSNGVAETINPSTAVVTPAAHGTVTNVSPGVFKYTDTDGSATSDSFVVAGATATCGGCSPSTSAPGNNVTVNVTIQAAVAYPANCDVTTQANCQLKQIVVIPVSGADLTMSQNGTPPVIDTLGHTVVGTNCSGPAVTLNGKPQNACGVMAPVTVTNARGSDAGWSLTGQISDFLDASVPPTTTCDTPGTFSSHCIPGGNLSWGPVAGVAHDVVPGDVAQVSAGTAIAPPSVLGAVLQSSGPLANTNLQANPVIEPAPVAGLHDSAQTLCNSASLHSGGTFECGANLVVAVPASAFAPGAPGYQAILTLTLA
jgi:Neocarzinostatin family